jgi:CheY-like chemotaxis protein
VEDTISIRKVTTQLLQRDGYVVVTATNGVEALDVLSKEVFDVVLMDLHMPVMDGIEAVKRLRAREAAVASVSSTVKDKAMKPCNTSNCSRVNMVIALTANASKDVCNELEALGFNGLLEKPINLLKLRSHFLSVKTSESDYEPLVSTSNSTIGVVVSTTGFPKI